MIAGLIRFTINRCFNTQPPEGGWDRRRKYRLMKISFNTQPPEGGWETLQRNMAATEVSTHSRLKAAGTVRLGEA